jgi:hypothetical protein
MTNYLSELRDMAAMADVVQLLDICERGLAGRPCVAVASRRGVPLKSGKLRSLRRAAPKVQSDVVGISDPAFAAPH